MRCPTLNELPPPPSGKIGWPWTEECLQLPATMVNMCSWPCISIVTINYNHSLFLEEAMRSVLLQGYPNLEYIIIDGGSLDSSVEIIRKYKPWLTYWISEKDSGPSHAFNKGLEKATGHIIGWVTATDFLLPGALEAVASQWVIHGTALYYGRCQAISEEGNQISRDMWLPPESCTWNDLLKGASFPMPSVFFPGCAVGNKVRIDETISVSNDWECCLRILESFPAYYINKHLTSFRIHGGQASRSVSVQRVEEHLRVLEKYLRKGNLTVLNRLHVVSAIGHFLIAKSALLFKNGSNIKGTITVVIGYILDWREWRRRLVSLLRNPVVTLCNFLLRNRRPLPSYDGLIRENSKEPR